MKQKEFAKEVGYSSSTLQRCRNDIKMQSTSKSNNPQRSPETSNDLRRPQLTSKDENSKLVSEKVKTKNILKGGNPYEIHNHARDLIEQVFSST